MYQKEHANIVKTFLKYPELSLSFSLSTDKTNEYLSGRETSILGNIFTQNFLIFFNFFSLNLQSNFL